MTLWMILVWELLLNSKLLEIVDWNDAVDNDDCDDDDDNGDALDNDAGKNDDIDDQMILGWVSDDVHSADDQVEPS